MHNNAYFDLSYSSGELLLKRRSTGKQSGQIVLDKDYSNIYCIFFAQVQDGLVDGLSAIGYISSTNCTSSLMWSDFGGSGGHCGCTAIYQLSNTKKGNYINYVCSDYYYGSLVIIGNS